MAKRQRVETALADWPAVDRVLNRLCELDAIRKEAEAQMSLRIDVIRAEYAEALDANASEAKVLKAQVEQFAVAHRGDFGDKKSYERLQGVLSFRLSTPACKPAGRTWTWQSILDAILARMPRFVRQVNEVDKAAILGAYACGDVSAEDLERVGIRIEQRESFGIELKVEEAPAAPEADYAA